MRIQHNIMAMSAYRNYTNNVSAMQKNLEKLSSGYKINRAGDDAAGLAISEKMRAQISGLEAAQKNAKDGISLVQTAEGALTEVHDMLNRMVTLATQSANGTYESGTDRTQLQKEINQLKEEINRISKASNFNGIQLLDGSMDQGGGSTTGDILIADVGSKLGDKTLLRTPATEEATAQFTLDLDTLTWNAKTGDKLEISLGTDKITLTATKDETYDAEALATAIKKQFEDDGGKLGSIEAAVEATGTSVTFTAKAAGTKDAFAVDRDVTLKLTPADGGDVVTMNDIQTFEEGDDKKLTVDGTAGNKIEVKAAVGGANATYTVSVAGKDKDALNGKKIDGVAITWDDAEGGDLASTMAAFVETYNKAEGKGYTASYASDTLTLTAKEKKEISTAPQTDISGSDANMTAGTTGAAPTTPAVTMDATGLDKEKILAAATGAKADDKITISLNTTDKKLELKVGNTVVGTSDAIADSNSETEFTFKTADETPVTLGKVTFSAAPTNSDTISGLETGLSIKEDGGNKDATGSGGVAFGSGEGAIDTSSNANLETALGKLAAGGDGKVDTTVSLTSDGVTALKTAFPTAGTGTKTTVTVTDGDKVNEALTVDLGAAMDSLKSDAKVSDLVNALKAAGEQAIKDWEKAPANADKKYTFELQWIATDAAGTNKLYDATNENSLALPSGVEGLYYSYKQVEKQSEDPTGGAALTGNFNAATTNNIKGADAAAGNYASTTFNLSSVFGSSIGDGSSITIAGSEYTFKLGDSFGVDVDGTTITLDKKLSGAALLEQAGEGLSLMNNTNFSIGHEGKGKIVLDERPTSSDDVQKKLTSKTDFESLLSYKSVKTKDESKGLVLQIGDTAADYNQIKVSIGACDTASLGIANIDISKQDSAQKAIDAIKTAINKVSDIRGDLGATQNRLDHTINNLSVMTENIQDAESTIRDVDVAEEMMAYTKNSILIQSAQAMLAQANQVPQGVLQLLG